MNKIKIKIRKFEIDGIEYKLHYQDCEESQSVLRKIDLALEAIKEMKRSIKDSENILKGN